MKILSININSIRARIEAFIGLLESGEFDVVCVQEIKVDDVNFPHNLFEASGYNIKVFGQKSYNGVAVFSKFSIEDAARGIPGFPDPAARFISCVIDGRIRLINVYMPNGEPIDSDKFSYKIEWMKGFSEHIRQYADSEEAVVICGDFNVALTDADVWDPHGYADSSLTAVAARREMQEWLNAGWVDCWRRFNPDARGFTWFAYYPHAVEKNQGLRLDYFLANKTALHNLKKCYIDMRLRMTERPTDHAGLVLEIE
ncbi:MAG: exodeoxyribonuclease III [Rickettsiales bacterium]|jgi:exodeoxyribonuclease-3|nr:exodeoxyribonuclease III [Rickettsiales bacterium]